LVELVAVGHKALWRIASSLFVHFQNLSRMKVNADPYCAAGRRISTTLAHFGVLAGRVGFPNQFFNDS